MEVAERDKPKKNPKSPKPVIYPTYGCPATPPPDPVPPPPKKNE